MSSPAGAELVEVLDGVALKTTEATLRYGGFVQPPTVHIVAEDLEPPYLGYLTCRPFRRGQDAHTAITGLGVLPCALNASRLVISWENADLRTALGLPVGDAFDTGVAVLDADRSRHTLRWHPMQLDVGPIDPSIGLPKVTPHWGKPARYPGAELPEPIAASLALWRSRRRWPDHEITTAYAGLSEAGYQMHWVRRSGRGRQPSWVRALAVESE